MSTNFSSARKRARFVKLPLRVWEGPTTSLPQLSDKVLSKSDEIDLTAISRDGKWYLVRHSGGLGWVSNDRVELPEPALEVPQGLKKIGLCANQALTPNGEIAARLLDPLVIADTGVRWVRLNFMQIGDRWLERYGEIVDGLRGRGLQIYATLSHDIVGMPGLTMQEVPQSTPDKWPQNYPQQMDWIERYIGVCEEILDTFSGRIGVYETLNEPDLWIQGKSWMHPHWFAYVQDRLYRQLKTSYPVKILSGSLQGTTSGNGAPHYLRAMYEFGRKHLDWRQESAPFDGVAYHIYNWPGDWGGTPEEAQTLYKTYLDQLWDVMIQFEEKDTDKRIYISEFGYPSTIDVSAPKAHEDWQAKMMEAAIELLADDERIALASWFCTEDFESPGEMFGLYVNGYGAKPTDRKQAFYTLRDLMTRGPAHANSDDQGYA